MHTTAITAPELRHLLAEDPAARVLDVRTSGEYQSLHIPGSYNVPLDTLGEHAADLAEVDHPVVLVCQSGARATRAGASLSAAGKSNLRVLEGGMGAWTMASGDVVRGPEKWGLERQVRGVAGGLVLTAVLTSVGVPGAKWAAGAVGAGLLFAAVSNTCAMGALLSKLPYNCGPRCDIDGVLAQMREPARRAA